MQIEITDDDIRYAEGLLLPSGCSFNCERRAFIRCMESRDVVACPGSGKTTALLAKLLILERKMPLPDGRGICVLTHTNVAMDEIKGRASPASAGLFRYPNFFGTIQSFVNRFLAGPWYRTEFDREIEAIDNDRFYQMLHSQYDPDVRLRKWLEPKGGIGVLGGYWFHPDTLVVGKDLDEPIPKLGQDTYAYRRIQIIRRGILAQGILSFHDAYSLALRYVARIPAVVECLSRRFGFVFLDEAQDTDGPQFRVLDSVFRSNRVIMQRIGDPNQAIFHDSVHCEKLWSPRAPLHFSDSRRWGNCVASLLSSVRLDDSICLQACTSVASLAPQLIAFQTGEEEMVLAAFSCLVGELSEALPPNGTYKAVGWIGKDITSEKRLCLPAYWPGFERHRRLLRQRFESFVSYATLAIRSCEGSDAGSFFRSIMEGVAQALRNAGIKDPASGHAHSSLSAAELWRRCHEASYWEFRSHIARCFREAVAGSLSPVDLSMLVRSATNSVWPDLSTVQTFFDEENLDPNLCGESAQQLPNRYVAPSGITIDVATVHSVKGETHTGTLYLETDYYRGLDGTRLIDFLEGTRPKPLLKKTHHQQNLKIAHVAFSRPTHLVAFACRASSISGHEAALRKNGWVLHTVSSLLSQGGGSS